MVRGIVRWFNQVSDDGFIARATGGPDAYVRGENVTGAPPVMLAVEGVSAIP